MKMRHVPAPAFALLFLAGCAPLQQAPLLYSSKVTVGLDVSASTTETPGASVSIGVKSVDAAYVPVAVSKDTTKNSAGDVVSHDIVRIAAVFGAGSTPGQVDQLTEENKTKIRAYLEAQRSEDAAKDAADKVKADLALRTQEIERLRQSLNDVETKRASAQRSATPDQEAIRAAEADLAALRGKLAESEGARGVLEARRVENERTWLARKAEAERLFAAAAQAASLLRTDKSDAMSVYGRFDSKGDGTASSSPSASLAVGKIFSTGVASQNLTEAVRDDARYGAAARCIEQVRTVVEKMDAAGQKVFAEKLNGVCRADR